MRHPIGIVRHSYTEVGVRASAQTSKLLKLLKRAKLLSHGDSTVLIPNSDCALQLGGVAAQIGGLATNVTGTANRIKKRTNLLGPNKPSIGLREDLVQEFRPDSAHANKISVEAG
jgi:hypothetical protein